MSPTSPSIDAELVSSPRMTLAAVLDMQSIACSYIVDIILNSCLVKCLLKSASWCHLHIDNTINSGKIVCKCLWFNMQPISYYS